MTHHLQAGDASLTVDCGRGARWTSWRVGDLELLAGAPPDVELVPEFRDGCFVMAPFAGRIGFARVAIGGAEHELPAADPPHAMHGFVAGAAWVPLEAGPDRLTAAVQLDTPWPVPGRVEQRLRLAPDRLESELRLRAGGAMPATIGWHPWFARQLARGDAAEWDLTGGEQYLRGPDHLPTGELAPPRPGPWDDAFRDFTRAPAIRWPGALRLSVASSARHFVLFDELPDVLCLEPQTGPPDAVRLGETAQLDAGGELVLRCTWRWEIARP